MPEVLKGCGYLYKPGPMRDVAARAFMFIEGEGMVQPYTNRNAYRNFDQIVQAAAELSLGAETAAYLDQRYSSQKSETNWRDVVPLVAQAVLVHPNIVTTTSDILKRVIHGKEIVEGGYYQVNFKNRRLNRRVQGSFAGIILNSYGKLSQENPMLTPFQEGACIDAMINASVALHGRERAGTVHELFTREEFSTAMDWIRPKRDFLVYRRG